MKFTAEHLILINAHITTLDPHFPKANWVVIKNDKLITIGKGEVWKDLRDKNSKIIDCRGKSVLPGFIDAHSHVVAYAKSFVTLDLSPSKNAHSISDIQTRVRDSALSRPSGDWILGEGYNEFYLAEKRHPNRWDLDKATSDHPVRLTHRSGHAHVLNSLALKLVGIHKATGDPDGAMIDRDLKTGEPTGLLYEMGDFLSDRIPPLSSAELEHGLQLANRELISSGITSIQDASSRNDTDRWKLYDSWKASDILQPRVNMMLGFRCFKKKNYQNLSTNLNASRLRLCAVKIILDATTGRMHPLQQELNEMVLEVHQAGMQVAIHAIEEETIEAACNAIKNALDKAPRKNHRHRIEHCAVCPPSLSKRIASLGILVVTQPPFVYYNGERYIKTVPEEQLKHLYPFRTLLDHGINLAGSSDCPIVPPNPLIGLFAAISRMDETGNLVGSEEKISVIDALRMYTQNAAQATFEETIKGTIMPGKLADLVVLNGDPTQLPPEEVKNLEVEMTLVGGQVVWNKEG